MEENRHPARNQASRLPEKPGVYLMADKTGKIIYVGKAKNLRKRVMSYFSRTHDSGKTAVMVGKIASIDRIVTASENEAFLLEANLIKKHNPRYNIQLRDSKTFPYLRITCNEDFPRIIKTRSAEKNGEFSFGPYSNVMALTETIKLLHRLFPIRYCKRKLTDGKKNGSVCLYYHINRCPGPCEKKISSSEYRKGIESAILFLKGKPDAVISALQKEMKELASAQEFERCARIRDRIEALREASREQAVHSLSGLPDKNIDLIHWHKEMGIAAFSVLQIRDSKLSGQNLYLEKNIERKPDPFRQFLNRYMSDNEPPAVTFFPPESITDTGIPLFQAEGFLLRPLTRSSSGKTIRALMMQARANARLALEEEIKSRLYRDGLKELGKILRLPGPPHIIEGFDIATMLGEETVAGMVHFENGRPVRSQHRHFIMKTVAGQDDFASIREAVARRYQRLLNEDSALPDLILIDGGRGQLNAALGILKALGLGNQPVASLAKKEELIFVPWQKEPLQLNKHHFPLRILQSVRDAVHDHVNSFHRKRRDKKRVRSELTKISGIGQKRAATLLKHFGSVKKIREASLEELAAAAGNRTIAERIFRHYQE